MTTKQDKAVWAVVSGTVGVALGIGLMVPAVTPGVVEVPAPAPTVTVTAEPTPEPTAEPTPTEAPLPAGHRAAAKRAQWWLEEMNWSPARIREQLVNGDDFTEAEADYGVSQLK